MAAGRGKVHAGGHARAPHRARPSRVPPPNRFPRLLERDSPNLNPAFGGWYFRLNPVFRGIGRGFERHPLIIINSRLGQKGLQLRRGLLDGGEVVIMGGGCGGRRSLMRSVSITSCSFGFGWVLFVRGVVRQDLGAHSGGRQMDIDFIWTAGRTCRRRAGAAGFF